MAAPTWQATGALASGTGNVTVNWPAHQADDIGLLVVESANQTIALGTANGFVEIPDSPQGTGTAGGTQATRLAVFWCRATSGSMGSPVITDPGDHAIAYIITFRGCKTSGNPWNVTAGDVETSSTTNFSIPGDTTTVAECLVAAIIATRADVDTGRASGWTNASLVSITERADLYTSVPGNGGGVSVACGVKSTAGAYNATTGTLSTTSAQGRISIALEPASANVIATPGLAAPVFAGFAPAVLLAIRIATATGAPVFTGGATAVVVSVEQPPTTSVGGALLFTGQSPAVQIGSNTIVQPGTGQPVFTGLGPAALVTVKIPVGLGQTVFSGLAPTAAVSDNKFPAPGLGQPVFTGFAPSVVAAVTAKPGVGEPIFTGGMVAAVLSDNKFIGTGLGQPVFTGFAPSVSVASNIVAPGLQQTVFTGFAPAVVEPQRFPIAVHRATVRLPDPHVGSSSLVYRAGSTIMDTYTADNDTGTADSNAHTADATPMRYS